MKNLFLFAFLFLTTAAVFADGVPSVFYLTSRPSVQAGVIRNFDDRQTAVLHDDIPDADVKACVHPESGRYVLSMTTSAFGNFDFGYTGHYFILGDIAKGAVGWTIPETNFGGKPYAESAPKFLQDGNRFFTVSTVKNNPFIAVYEFQTGASDRVFFNRWPRTFYRGIPAAVLSSDGKRAVFTAARGRKIEMYNYTIGAPDTPAPVFRLREVPFNIYPGRDLIVYKTTQYLRHKQKKTVLSFYDLKISENYRIFSFMETSASATDFPWQDFAVDERNKLCYTVNRDGDKSRIYRINMHTLKVDPFYQNALRVYDISRDGRYLLFTRYRDEAELTASGLAWRDDPQVIAVLDLQTREYRLMEVPGAFSYKYLAFVYR
jgi:hypothetical protein